MINCYCREIGETLNEDQNAASSNLFNIITFTPPSESNNIT